MNTVERLKLVQELTLLTAEVRGEKSRFARLKKKGRIIAIVKMLGGTVSEGAGAAKLSSKEDRKITSDEELVKAWIDLRKMNQRQGAQRKFDEAGIEYLQKAHPTLLITEFGYPLIIYQYQGQGKWQWWARAARSLNSLRSGIDQEGIGVLKDFIDAKTNPSRREAKDITLHGAPTWEDFYQNSAESPEWQKDRETLQSIIDGKHPDMRRPALYDTFTAVSKRQKGNPECPALFEQAVFAWQAVAYEMTDKIVA